MMEEVFVELRKILNKNILFYPSILLEQVLLHGYYSVFNAAIKGFGLTVPDDGIPHQNMFLKSYKDIERRLRDDELGNSTITYKDNFDKLQIEQYKAGKARVNKYIEDNEKNLKEKEITKIKNNLLKMNTRIFIENVGFSKPPEISKNERYNQLYDFFRVVKIPTQKPLLSFNEYKEKHFAPHSKVDYNKELEALKIDFRTERINRVKAILREN